jgi:ABC-2 type transport system ATP-binding protein
MLRLEHVSKRFGRIVAVDDLSLAVETGEVFGLLGPNGAGKTTTINMAIGQLAPDSGAVRFADGGVPRHAEFRRRIGVAPQDLALYEELSADHNLRFFGTLYGLSGVALRRRVEAVLNLVGLYDRRDGRVKTFSGGMQRRLNLAVALIHDPPLLVLDEPTAGVDPQSRNAIFELVERFRDEGRTVIYTTHYMEEAQRLCDRVGIIDRGRLLALDTVPTLLADAGGQSAVIAETAAGEERIETDDARGALTDVLQRSDVVGVRIERANLETVFLNLTGRGLRD